jgi:hypothetical protein
MRTAATQGTRAEDATSSLDGGHDAGAVGPSDDAGPPLGPPLLPVPPPVHPTTPM